MVQPDDMSIDTDIAFSINSRFPTSPDDVTPVTITLSCDWAFVTIADLRSLAKFATESADWAEQKKAEARDGEA